MKVLDLKPEMQDLKPEIEQKKSVITNVVERDIVIEELAENSKIGEIISDVPSQESLPETEITHSVPETRASKKMSCDDKVVAMAQVQIQSITLYFGRGTL